MIAHPSLISSEFQPLSGSQPPSAASPKSRYLCYALRSQPPPGSPCIVRQTNVPGASVTHRYKTADLPPSEAPACTPSRCADGPSAPNPAHPSPLVHQRSFASSRRRSSSTSAGVSWRSTRSEAFALSPPMTLLYEAGALCAHAEMERRAIKRVVRGVKIQPSARKQQGTTCPPSKTPHATAKRSQQPPGNHTLAKTKLKQPATQAERGGRTTSGLFCCAGSAKMQMATQITAGRLTTNNENPSPNFRSLGEKRNV